MESKYPHTQIEAEVVETKKPKISVIIPVYNVEKYLEECLTSVINQEFKDIEIICINDGSTDNSLSILEKFKNKDSRIKILSQKNKGQSSARNLGIDNAKGDYIYFLDSDDYISLDYIKNMYENITEYNADIVINDNILNFKDGNNDIKSEEIENKFNNGLYNINNDFIKQRLINITVWSKLYKKSVIEQNHIKFPENIKCEDGYFYYAYYTSIKTAVQNNQGIYFYRIRNNSTTHNKQKSLENDIIGIFKLIYELFKSNNLLDKYDLPYSFLGYRSTLIGNYKRYRKEVLKLIDIYNLNIKEMKKDKKLKALLYSPNLFIYRINKFLFSIIK